MLISSGAVISYVNMHKRLPQICQENVCGSDRTTGTSSCGLLRLGLHAGQLFLPTTLCHIFVLYDLTH